MNRKKVEIHWINLVFFCVTSCVVGLTQQYARFQSLHLRVVQDSIFLSIGFYIK